LCFLILVVDILHNSTLLSVTNHYFKIAVVVVVGGVGGGAVVTRVILLYPCHLMCQYLNSMCKDLSYTVFLIHKNQSAINFFLHFRYKNVVKSLMTENGLHIVEFMFFLPMSLSVTDMSFKNAMDCISLAVK
jgi:hypothetical protein